MREESEKRGAEIEALRAVLTERAEGPFLCEDQVRAEIEKLLDEKREHFAIEQAASPRSDLRNVFD